MHLILNHDTSWLVKANFYKLEPAINQHTYEKVFIVKTRFCKFVQFLKLSCVRQVVVVQYHRSSEFLWFCFVIRGVQLAALCLLNLGQLEQEPKNRASIYVLLDMVSTCYTVIFFFFLVSVGSSCSPVMSERVLQTGRPLFRPICTSSVQCRHWSRHMVKTSFIYRKRVQLGAMKLVLWRHWMRVTQVHLVTAEDQFHCNMLYSRSCFVVHVSG